MGNNKHMEFVSGHTIDKYWKVHGYPSKNTSTRKFFCEHCKIPGHGIERSWKVHGYPPGRGSRVAASASVDSPGSDTVSLTQHQYNQLVNFINKQSRVLLLHKSFGCPCFANTLKRNRDKFQPRAKPYVFIGYPYAKKGYKVMDLQSHQVSFSRDVTSPPIPNDLSLPTVPITLPSPMTCSFIKHNFVTSFLSFLHHFFIFTSYFYNKHTSKKNH
ncbi:hypothetical protein V2J09_018460 [Rumex salicifolius]